MTARAKLFIIVTTVCFACAFSRNTSAILEDGKSELRRMNTTCELILDNRSVNYFRSRLDLEEPNIIYFFITFNGTDPKSVKEAFYPDKWVWTYATSKNVYPYMYWKIDYDIFSFDLLDVKTIRVPYILFYQSGSCNLTYGTIETTKLITETLNDIVQGIEHTGFNKYQTSYWCYLAEVPGIRHTVQYFLGLYLDYPVLVVQYNCCYTSYHYDVSKYVNECPDHQMEIWPECTIYPFIFGILLFVYSPISILEMGAYLSKNETLVTKKDTSDLPDRRVLINGHASTSVHEVTERDGTKESDWIYLDGAVPLSFTDLFRSLFRGTRFVAYSRIRRFICVLLAPSLIYAKLIIYGSVQFKTTNDLMDRGAPFGFLSLIANTTNGRISSFVPILGGPLTIVLTFYLLSIVFFVFPASLKQIVQNGLPSARCRYFPICLGATTIKQLSQIPVKDDPGYKNAANHLRCSFYMLFNSLFWKTVINIQKERFSMFLQSQAEFCKHLLLCLLPLYILACCLELVGVILLYLIPLMGIIVIMIRGAIVYIADKMRRGGRVSLLLLNNKFFIAISVLIVAIIMTFYIYSVCLVFIESFIFLSEFFVYSYLAVIIYPGISFGYLFCAVVLGYYVVRRIRSFGVNYLDLLNDIVEISLNIEQQDNHVTNFDGHLVLSNIKISAVKSIKINGKVYPVAANMQHAFRSDHNRSTDRLRFRNNAYGIRKDLFDYIINKHLPVHQQVLKVLFQLVLIVLFLLFTITLTGGSFTGPTSQITEVIHVVFIVSVGALPRVLEAALSDSSEHIERDLQMRSLENSVCQYWREREADDIS